MNLQIRVVLAVALCVLIMAGSEYLFPKPAAPVVTTDAARVEGTKEAAKGTSENSALPATAKSAPGENTGATAPAVAVAVKEGTVANERMRLDVTNAGPQAGGLLAGGRLLEERFRGQETETTWLRLGQGRTLEVGFAEETTDFRVPKDTAFEVVAEGPKTWRLRHGDGAVAIDVDFELGEAYESALRVEVENRSGAAQNHQLRIRLHAAPAARESQYDLERGLCRTQANGFESKDRSDVDDGQALFQEPVIWGGVDSKYFLKAVVPAEPFVACSIGMEGSGPGRLATSLLEGPVRLEAGEKKTYQFGVFLGPKYVEDLQGYAGAGHAALEAGGLSDAIDWGIFGALSESLGRLLLRLMRWFYDLTGVWGIAIILLTVLVKGATLPLTLKQMNSMKRMKTIQPELEKIRAKYADDKQKQMVETQALFARSGVNPLAGCFPMLVQTPIWLALYSMLGAAVELMHVPFLWLPDLTQQDPYYILPVALGAMMVLQSRLTPTTSMDPAQAKMMQWGMPLMFAGFMLFLPSGLVVYIFVNTLLGVIQTAIQVGGNNEPVPSAK